MDTVDTDPFRSAPATTSSETDGGARTPRDSLLLSASLREADEATTTIVRVRNLSAGGLMAEHPTRYPRDTPVEIELRGVGKVSGRIAWATDGRIGIAFDRMIDPLAARKPVGQGAGTSWPPR